jgi:hypothetical protein
MSGVLTLWEGTKMDQEQITLMVEYIGGSLYVDTLRVAGHPGKYESYRESFAAFRAQLKTEIKHLLEVYPFEKELCKRFEKVALQSYRDLHKA